MSSCSIIIERNVTSWVCDLEDEHDGPHMAHGDAKSVRERADWMEAQTPPEPKLAEFQGEAQTTAERYTENPTPHPAVEAEQKKGPLVKDLKLTNPNASVCKACISGDHLLCIHRAELIAVVFHDKPQLEAWCSCFQDNRPAHGVGDNDQLFPHSGQSAPTPTPEPQSEEKLASIAGTMAYEDGPPVPEEPTKQRPGDQELPRPTGEPAVQDRIIAKAKALADRGDMTPEDLAKVENMAEASKKVGIQRYGTPLQTFNGRNTLQDAEDEARDLFVYLSSLNQAAGASKEQMIGLCIDMVESRNQAGEAMSLPLVVEIVVDTILGAVGSLEFIRGE